MKLGTVRQAAAVLRCGNRHSPGPECGFGLFEVFGQPTPPRPFLPELAASLQHFELTEQRSTVDQEGLADLITAEAVKQLDGAAAADAEDLLDGGTIQDRNFERRNGRADGGKLKKPGGLSRQGGESSLFYVTAQLC